MIIRKAVVSDVPEIRKLIEPFVKDRLILPKSLHSLYSSLRDFWILTDDAGMLIGCSAVQVSWDEVGEIRTLAVRKDMQGRGYGLELVKRCLNEARDLGLKKIFTLTYKEGFFKKAGFKNIDKSRLPNKIWADCIHCPHFPDCDETAMMYTIR
ncbi:MAG TPA: N-acetyltransferase [Desulfomonilia bacterium]